MENMQQQKTNVPLNKNLALIGGAILLVCLIIVITIFRKPTSQNSVNSNTGNNNVPTQQPEQPIVNQPSVNPSGPIKVSIDDDAVLGDKNAPITLIEFSDYECPFCKRHFDQVYSEIRKNYIDTGKLKLVYRDF